MRRMHCAISACLVITTSGALACRGVLGIHELPAGDDGGTEDDAGDDSAGDGGGGPDAGGESGGDGPCVSEAGDAAPPSCVPAETGSAGLTNCGPTGSESCCASSAVAGGTFKRGYDGVGYLDKSHPATVSAFRLDRYEVTVGRFRQFVNAVVNGGWQPAPGSGKHAHLRCGQGLVSPNDATTFELGWQIGWTAYLAQTQSQWTSALQCAGSLHTWTAAPAGNENRPIDCVSWYEAYAFCIWDGGFLPSEAEWNYAAAGGQQQRAYPWSQSPSDTYIDCTFANYLGAPDGGTCYPTVTNDVGSESPKGDGHWGQADLAGNVWEWVLDWYSGSYANPCTDCVALQATSGARVFRGSSYAHTADLQLVSWRGFEPPQSRMEGSGVRCSRAP